ncbi:MAG: archease [Patescibacteria group bacterium]|nr:archease [Patescibacteria group bacterium]
MYEQFEHTADLGLRIHAASMAELFVEAAHALTNALVERLDSIEPAGQRTIRLEATEPTDLLHDWLAELLYLFAAERMLFRRFDVSLLPGKLEATAWGEPLDPRRHEIGQEIKAVTYHGLKIEPTTDGGWLAEVIVDL